MRNDVLLEGGAAGGTMSCYVLRNDVLRSVRYVLYVWIGSDASRDDRQAAQAIVASLVFS